MRPLIPVLMLSLISLSAWGCVAPVAPVPTVPTPTATAVEEPTPVIEPTTTVEPTAAVESTATEPAPPATETPVAVATREPNPLPFPIALPPGFGIELYATNISNARAMVLSPGGTLFVGTRTKGNLYAVVDADQDYQADEVILIDQGLNMPAGVAFRDGSLYVSEVGRILRYDDIEADLQNPPQPVVVNDQFPENGWHGWKYLRIGPDDKLYVPVGSPCNVCENDDPFGTITRMNLDGSELEVYVRGVRNSVGLDFDPRTGDLWFTDNGRDEMGDDLPPDELNHVTAAEQHFGFPYCHGGSVAEPEFPDRSCDEFVAPAQPLGPHVAALGMRFYTGDMFPAEYHNQIFIAEHGSWNRSEPIGYRVMMVRLDENGEVVSYEPFAEGWQTDRTWGRPADLLVMPDGSMLVSDDTTGAIYRIYYRS